jgi:serine/threonine-protein kinase
MTTRLQHFAKQLEESGILDADTLRDFLPPKAQPKDTHELARELIRHKKLTRFQAEEAYRGKAQSLVLGNYILLDKIGAGGMGQVFRARHRLLDRVVAVKLLPTGMMQDRAVIERFEREVRAAGKLNHPNIVRAENADQANGIHFLVMEYVDGGDLSKRVKKQGPMSVAQAVDCVLQAARGLAYAHGVGVVHRDIKPANLLLDTKGVVKILDMGLARMTGEGTVSSNPELTSTGTIMGTAQYMAPEQALDTRAADHRADIYSLGCTLYYLLAARAMYQGESVMRTIFAHREQPIPPLRDVRPEASGELDEIFRTMVAKDVDDRFQSMTELIQVLEVCTPLLSDEQAAGPAKPRFSAASRAQAATSSGAASSGAASSGAMSQSAVSSKSARSRPNDAGVPDAAEASSGQFPDFLAELGTAAQRKRTAGGKGPSGKGAGAGGRATGAKATAGGPTLAERIAAIPPLWWVVGGSSAMLLILLAVLAGLMIVFLGSSRDEAPQRAQAKPPTAASGGPGSPAQPDKPATQRPSQGNAPNSGLKSGSPVSGSPVSGSPVSGGAVSGGAKSGSPVSGGAKSGSPKSGGPSSGDPPSAISVAGRPNGGPSSPAGLSSSPTGALAGAIAASAKPDGGGPQPSVPDSPFPKIDFQFPGVGGNVKPGEWRAMLEPDALADWKQLDRNKVVDGVLRLNGPGSVLIAPGYYRQFEMELEFRLADAGDSGVGIYYGGNGNPAQQGIEVQLVDDNHNSQDKATARCASLYDLVAAEGGEFRQWPAWNQLRIRGTQLEISVELNGAKVVSAKREQLRTDFPRHQGVLSNSGHICLCPIRGEQEYRHFRVREIQ